MNTTTILNSIQSAIDTHNLPIVQKGDLTVLLSDYSTLLSDYSTLTNEEKTSLFEEVRKQRPLIGKNLQERFEKDLSV